MLKHFNVSWKSGLNNKKNPIKLGFAHMRISVSSQKRKHLTPPPLHFKQLRRQFQQNSGVVGIASWKNVPCRQTTQIEKYELRPLKSLGHAFLVFLCTFFIIKGIKVNLWQVGSLKIIFLGRACKVLEPNMYTSIYKLWHQQVGTHAHC